MIYDDSQEMANRELKKLKVENERLKAQLFGLQGGEKTTNKVEEQGTPLSSQEVLDRDPEENEKILEIIKEVEEANRKGRKKVPEKNEAVPTSTKVATAKKATKTVTKKANAVKASKERSLAPKAVAKKAPTSKKKSPASKTETSGTQDWSQLSDSTLKRKTIVQLKEYLLNQKSADSAEVANLKKVDLIALVKKS
jgi:hypothetical protein